MRQAGIIAAAGIVALEHMVERLAEDHANALRLANGLADVKGISIDLEKISTNIVYMDLLGDLPSDEVVQRLEKVRCEGARRRPSPFTGGHPLPDQRGGCGQSSGHIP